MAIGIAHCLSNQTNSSKGNNVTDKKAGAATLEGPDPSHPLQETLALPLISQLSGLYTLQILSYLHQFLYPNSQILSHFI